MKNTDKGFEPLSGVVRPGPGQTAHYYCRSCGERFTRKIPLFFAFVVRCPKCGSFRVDRDPMVVY